MYLILHINKGGKPILNFFDFSFSFFFYISFQINISILQTDFMVLNATFNNITNTHRQWTKVFKCFQFSLYIPYKTTIFQKMILSKTTLNLYLKYIASVLTHKS
jgi:hypothetical protein